ncbi:DNA-binding transcription regulator [Phycomyces blakesleeanus]|uniref:phenylalanine--tRNA ligase n=1 Tax=Phycomyces blakesleeanus (strain ATCC 8743b / DSM 1359 / FGSC 10004 / NBRC 33097 / NRRL 1555) TaxID=763407 RepID=A0A162NH88_PHYB8|nr:DNA-binding transcription regulator [Phycomyces blakesleeanus NRRL 1555(-)]OAD69624.1 DNA-binding transcription regulator [Phycomyces blakesleeanus NRRL 1555(-)]|eukprot:XP_018287664.1 DNA-binding transcription regulator [Phycomyces blakesleeanus NRRL 1555(-)]
MPTVNVDKQALFKALERDYTSEEFNELCFRFGIELEEDTSEKEMAERGGKNASGLSDRPLLKIDIPANRYDLLCQEGLARALRIFEGKQKGPEYKLVKPANGKLERLIVKPETAQIRPYVVAAILRDVAFTQENYNSFIDLQDKLHNNICRKRSLASMGTHDLDTIKGPFTYEALPHKDIKFIPLNKNVVMDGDQLMEHYTNDKHLGKFLDIIRESPVYPVVFDANRVVCSLPPIINSEHSKIKLSTKNVFIEITATDEHKANIVLSTLVAMFSEYCAKPFTVEPVEIVYPDNTVKVTPLIDRRLATAKIDYINSCTDLSLSSDEICALLGKMSLEASLNPKDKNELLVQVPPTRWDILHACDIMEDVAISYGYDNLTKRMPSVNTVASALPVNKLSDHARRELALSGFTEVAPLILCSHDENFKFLNRVDDNTEAIKLANPKTIEYQVVRTSLLPGILKTLNSNKKLPLPIKLFEVSDVGFKDETKERRARNERRVCATYTSKASGFEVIHGLLNRLMEMFMTSLISKSSTKLGYWIEESENPTYFPGRSADIHLRYVDSETNERKEIVVGSFGVLHPTVLSNFDLTHPTTALEFNLEPFV